MRVSSNYDKIELEQVGEQVFNEALKDKNFKTVEAEWEDHDGTVWYPIAILGSFEEYEDCLDYMKKIRRDDPYMLLEMIGPSGRTASYTL